MSRKSAYIVFVAVAIVATLAALGTVALLRPSLQPKPSPSPDVATYQNDAYGFELTYPKKLVPKTTFRQYYALSDKWRSQAPEGQAGVAVVAIPVFRVDNPLDGVATGKPYPLYFSAEVRVGVSTDTQAVADCLKTDPGYTDQKHETVTLNGAQFEKFEFGDAAMMQYSQGVSYRTVRNNTCFAVEQLKAGSIYRDDSMTAGIPDSQLDAYYAQAGEMAQTFRFTK